jgi:hypothetical protein
MYSFDKYINKQPAPYKILAMPLHGNNDLIGQNVCR